MRVHLYHKQYQNTCTHTQTKVFTTDSASMRIITLSNNTQNNTHITI